MPNALKRYSLGTKNKDLVYGPDGSLNFYVQATPPSDDKLANWLPAPQGEFALFLRAYWREEPILGGNWAPPPAERLQ